MDKYEITVKKNVVETYTVEAWSAKQAKAEWENLIRDQVPTFAKSEVKRVSVGKANGEVQEAQVEEGSA